MDKTPFFYHWSRGIIKQRRNFFAGEETRTLDGRNFRGGQYRELVAPINEVLDAFEQQKMESFVQFKQYLCSCSTSTLPDLCALNTILAASLRHLTYKAKIENLELYSRMGFNQDGVVDGRDQVDAEVEALQITASLLQLELHTSMQGFAHMKSYKNPLAEFGWGDRGDNGDHTTPEGQPIYIKCNGNYKSPHWDCLIEPEQFEHFPALLSVLPAADQATQDLKTKLAVVLENSSFLKNELIGLNETLEGKLTRNDYLKLKPIIGQLLSDLFSMSHQQNSEDLIREKYIHCVHFLQKLSALAYKLKDFKYLKLSQKVASLILVIINEQKLGIPDKQLLPEEEPDDEGEYKTPQDEPVDIATITEEAESILAESLEPSVQEQCTDAKRDDASPNEIIDEPDVAQAPANVGIDEADDGFPGSTEQKPQEEDNPIIKEIQMGNFKNLKNQDGQMTIQHLNYVLELATSHEQVQAVEKAVKERLLAGDEIDDADMKRSDIKNNAISKLIEINDYYWKRDKDPREYFSCYARFFGGYSKTKKLEAAEEAMSFVAGEKADISEDSKKVMNQGRSKQDWTLDKVLRPSTIDCLIKTQP